MYEGWTAVLCRLGGSDGDVSCIDAGGQGGHHALQSGRQSKRPGEHLRRLARGCMKPSGPNDARAEDGCFLAPSTASMCALSSYRDHAALDDVMRKDFFSSSKNPCENPMATPPSSKSPQVPRSLGAPRLRPQGLTVSDTGFNSRGRGDGSPPRAWSS